jgi:hypothetical protein
MAENQEKSAKRFTFEADTEDSHYLAVKRIEYDIEYYKTQSLLEDNLIKLLPNADIQLTLGWVASTARAGQLGMYK